ncbi:Ribosomal large subunit pseudouridine synthase D [compost metagenome]
MGHPLYGDELYGGPVWASSAAGRHALHGEALSFRHPWSGEQLEVSDPWPEDMLQLRELLSEAP